MEIKEEIPIKMVEKKKYIDVPENFEER